jgi:hypothetical protein
MLSTAPWPRGPGLSPTPLNMAIIVADGLRGFHAGIKAHRRIDGTMPEKLAEDFVRTRVSFEEEVAGQMSKLVCRHAHTHLSRDEIGNLLAEQGLAFVAIALAGE